LQRVCIAGGADLDVRSLLDRMQYADPLGEAQAAGISAANWPLFGQLWPAARKLADLMQTWHFGTARMLELGCGLGLASLVLHRRGADITASDCHPLTEIFLRANIAINRMADLKYRDGHWGRPNPGLGRYDVLLGSDLLYERGQAETLSAFIAAHANERAEVIIVDPDRTNRSAFHRAMARGGFVLTETPIVSSLQDGSAFRGRALHYRRQAG
jgi:2-polyprenyl-3-methyl-5-hydroxy-6-metoxy-1,4-benzoquinol methylase